MSDIQQDKPKRPYRKGKTPELAAKQDKTKFKKGETSNPNGGRLNFRKPTIQMRETMHKAIVDAAFPMLINILYDSYETKDRKDMLGILEFMFKYAYGIPKEMQSFDDITPQQQQTNNAVIVVDKKDLLDEMEKDKLYQ